MEYTLKPGMLLGAATAATQIEGGDQNNNWYDWYRRGYIKDNSDPSVATEHYVRWREDLDLMADMGLQCYRFGLEWSRIEPEDLMGLDCAFGIEVWNYDTVNECALGADTVYWDMLLRRGIHVGAIAADDNHNPGTFDDAFGGWVVVCAPELTRDAVVRALLDGRYYSSSGPEVHGFGVNDGRAWIECSPCERVNLICGGPIGVGETRIAPEGELLERAEFTLRGTETYLRFECVGANGRTAWTNALR